MPVRPGEGRTSARSRNSPLYFFFTFGSGATFALLYRSGDPQDKAKAEKAFNDAKTAAILWLTRTPAQGLGWVKIKEKGKS